MKIQAITVLRILTPCLAWVCIASTALSLDFSFPRLANLLNISEKADDEIREEDRVSEVLNRDAAYTSLFRSVNNPDIAMARKILGESLAARYAGDPERAARFYVED